MSSIAAIERPRPIDLAELIDRRPMSAIQVWVAVLCAATLFVDGYDIQVMALAVPSLAQAWSLPPSSFGWALTGVVIGITAGSGLLGPLGDRFGRRTMLVITMTLVGLTTCATALSSAPTEFVVWRVLTGLALGAGIPSCAALTSEYAPVANRSLVMGLMNVASPSGAFAGGFLAPVVLEGLGWRGTFVIGGVAPLVIGVLALGIPESLKFLLVRRPGDPRIARYLKRIAPEVDPSTVSTHAGGPAPRVSPLELLNDTFRARTLLLWGLLILNLFNLYVLISWLPTLLKNSGWALADALRGAVLIQGGGIVGGVLLSMSRLMDRGATRAALAGGFLLSAASLVAFAFFPGQGAWAVLLLLAGAGICGSQLGLNTLSAGYYPPAIKATGVGWALVIGGAGMVAGPLAGGELIDLGLSPAAILAVLAVPSLVCALSVAFMRREWQAY